MKSESFRQRVEDAKIEGWEVDEDGDERVVLVKRSYGDLGPHILIFFLSVWWTFGIGNAAYAGHKYFNDPETKVIRDTKESTSQ